MCSGLGVYTVAAVCRGWSNVGFDPVYVVNSDICSSTAVADDHEHLADSIKVDIIETVKRYEHFMPAAVSDQAELFFAVGDIQPAFASGGTLDTDPECLGIGHFHVQVQVAIGVIFHIVIDRAGNAHTPPGIGGCVE